MRMSKSWACMLTAALMSPVAAQAVPPPRPVPLTPAQYQRLKQVEQQPSHAMVRNLRASYSSDRERNLEFNRASDDFWTAAHTGGFPIGLLIILIAAAPL